MSILKVAQLGHPVLTSKMEEVDLKLLKKGKLDRFISDMVDTMIEYDGVGLAAPQVHNPIRLLVIDAVNSGLALDESEKVKVIVNPLLKDFSDEKSLEWEGCLSLGNLLGKVKRSISVTVEGFDHKGEPIKIEAKGYSARVLQHEIDHLYGKLFIDRIESAKDISFKDEFTRYHQDEDRSMPD